MQVSLQGDQMVLLARTSAQRLERMIRFNLDNACAVGIGHLDPAGFWLIGP